MTQNIRCWSCETEWGDDPQPIVCRSCKKVQKIRPGVNPYWVLGYAETPYSLDPEELESRWIKRSRKCHPDRFATREAQERRHAVEQMAATNDAYKILQSDIARGAYLLEQKEWPTEAFPPESFLVEMMEAQEEAHEPSCDRKEMRKRFEARFSADREVLMHALDSGGLAPEEAAAALTRLRYYRRVLDALSEQTPEI